MMLRLKNSMSWRAWLEQHHSEEKEVWMVFFRKPSREPGISYEQAVEEALCFGWIDSLVKRLDEKRYARKFTPRTNTSKWSQLNLRRVERLKAEGRMTKAGLSKIDPDVRASKPPAKREETRQRRLAEALATLQERRKLGLK